MKKILFCNIGWMRSYKGLVNDEIIGGGKNVRLFGSGGEIFNFLSYKGYMYGYVQPHHSSIKLERIGNDVYNDKIKNVTIIWLSTRPNFGSVIIGWYKNATLYRYMQDDCPDKRRKNQTEYFIKAKSRDAKLLSIDERFFKIKRGKNGLGQSNVWFADAKPNLNLRQKVFSYIKNPLSFEKQKHNKKAQKLGKRNQDPFKRQETEKKAVQRVIKHYSKLGYKVKSVEREKIGWDLEARRKDILLKIEVKGLSSSNIIFELTPNEYKSLLKKEENYRLCVVSSIQTKSKLNIFSYSSDSDQWEDEDSVRLKIEEKIAALMSIK